MGKDMRREIVAGATTFLTLAYIMFVNPKILGAAGLDEGAVFTATCLASAITTALMGLYAKLPVALAPGMGLNAYFAFTVVPALGGDWRLALGCVFLSGILFVAISLSPARAWLIDAIPRSLKLGIAAGIGFFLALIGFENAGITVASPATLIREGALADPKVLIAAGAFVLMFALAARGVVGAVLIGIVAAKAAGSRSPPQELQPLPGAIASLPPSLAPTFLQMHFGRRAARARAIATVVFVFLLVDMLDTSGTLTAVALDAEGRLPNARRALATDALEHDGRRSARHLAGDGLYRERDRHPGGRTHGRHSADRGGTFPGKPVLFAPRRRRARLRHRAGAGLRCRPDGKGAQGHRLDDLTEAGPALLIALAIPLHLLHCRRHRIGFIAMPRSSW